ncbi:hypothetical protein HOE31_01885 [bacterium]|jgi:hypothetical protein|nr:hypothetical protein [bacterium]MBT4121681.1 hypothetical protein [bacterium]MBT4496030.1 hypothetical protein [bacterium]MBT4763841.1 hypothetical protein [bacterium]MBT5401211.1 hypothetical protein [bacterium]
MLLSQKTKITKTATIALVLVFAVAVFMLLTTIAFAQDDFGLEPVVESGLGTTDIRLVIINIIRVALGFLGILAVIIILYGGYVWMTSAGNDENVNKAKRILVNGVIGLVIILSSYAIVTFVFNKMEDVIFGDGSEQGSGYQNSDISAGALGGGVIESVYPLPGANNVPRNTLIMVSFKEEILLDSIITGTHANCPENISCGILAGDSEDPNVKILNLNDNSIMSASDVMVYTTDLKNYIFDPYGSTGSHLGNPNGYTDYQVNLSTNIYFNNDLNTPVFSLDGYTWNFEISNIIDLTPPTIISRIPQGEVNRNVVIQIVFSEAINAAAAVNLNSVDVLYENVAGEEILIEGSRVISNGFTTLTIVSDIACEGPSEFNSCGDPVYCFPGDEDISVTVKAVTDPLFPLAGISDTAGNSLALDNSWLFNTNNELDLDPPELESIDPVDNAELVPRNKVIEAVFNEDLLASSVNSTNVLIYNGSLNDTPYTVNLNNHDLIRINATMVGNATYSTRLTSGIKDIYQNCFIPPLTNP